LVANETIYARLFFPIPQQADAYVVGSIATIDNKLRTHHYVVYGCTEPVSEYTDLPLGKPFIPQTAEDNGAALLSFTHKPSLLTAVTS
jgi:hypothetical protein